MWKQGKYLCEKWLLCLYLKRSNPGVQEKQCFFWFCDVRKMSSTKPYKKNVCVKEWRFKSEECLFLIAALSAGREHAVKLICSFNTTKLWLWIETELWKLCCFPCLRSTIFFPSVLPSRQFLLVTWREEANKACHLVILVC